MPTRPFDPIATDPQFRLDADWVPRESAIVSRLIVGRRMTISTETLHMKTLLEIACAVVALTVLGCAQSNPPIADLAAPDEWSLVGKRIIACCCGTPCPCRLNAKPMHRHGCDSPTIVHVDRGSIRGVDVSGLTWVLIQRSFAEVPSGNWAYVYVDERATKQQQEAIGWLLDNGFASIEKNKQHTLGKFEGMRPVAIAWSEEAGANGAWSVSIPKIFELRVKPLVNPGHADPVRSIGVLDDYGDRFVHCQTLKHSYDDPQIGKKWELTGRQSNRTEFALDAKRIKQGGIGWGCWSAHSELGDNGKYQEEMIGHE